MRERRPSWAAYRAAIGVVALYALALQAFFGGLAGVATPHPMHVLCDPGAAVADGSTGEEAGHKHLPCCTVPHAAVSLLAPAPAVTTIAWPIRHAVAFVWRPEAAMSPRAPPGIAASARAPPVV